MVKSSTHAFKATTTHPFLLTITFHVKSVQKRDIIFKALQPEFPAIDSKRVRFHSKPSQNQIVFHLAAQDVTALRATATSLMRLYLVADGVHHLTVIKNG